jgi:GH25 family lysozyme M1 (1,4-beta-N-acetylmuramidase)
MNVQGIDVSNWQGAFSWAPWKGRIGFGMARATEGDGQTDPDLKHNWDSMWFMQPDHRFVRAAYHFFHAAQDPVVQAAHFTATVKGHGLLPGDLLVADFEATDPATGLNDGVPPAVFAGRAVTFLHQVSAMAPGHKVLAYMDPSFAHAGHSAGMGCWDLWIADYGISEPAVPAPWQHWTFWQSTDSPVDGDRYNGDVGQLLAYSGMPARR